MRSILVSLSLAASALALAVTYPGPAQGWPATGSQEVKWVKTAATDPQNFTIVLTGDAALLPNGPQVLLALAPADADSGSSAVRPPSTGWPVGKGFRIQIAKSASELSTVITTSEAFTIGLELSSTTSSSSSSTPGPTNTVVAPTVNTPSNSADTPSPTDALGQDNSALTPLSASGLIPLLAMIGFAFA